MTSLFRHKHILPFLLLLLGCFIPTDAFAQSLSVDLGDGVATDGSFAGNLIQIVALLTVLSIAPGILMMTTSFTRIVVVFSLLRSAMGVQQTPPSMILISLAMFLTFFIMMPVFEQSYEQGIRPLMNEDIEITEAFERSTAPLKTFMLSHTREKDLQLFMGISGTEGVEKAEDTPLQVVIPSFMISELRKAFEIGFLLFLPFLVIDMVTASVLMSMGMMMLPPILISLPFKIIFFVVVDGWYLVAGSLVQSYGFGPLVPG